MPPCVRKLKRLSFSIYKIWLVILVSTVIVMCWHNLMCTSKSNLAFLPNRNNRILSHDTKHPSDKYSSNSICKISGDIPLQMKDGKCSFIPLTAHDYPAQTDSDMKDWTFGTTHDCKQFSIKLETKVRDKISIDCGVSPPKMVTSKTDRSSDLFTVDFGDECLVDFIDSCCKDDKPVPNVVHLIWYVEKELGYFNFLSLISIIRFMKPCLILLHGPNVPYGKYWDFVVNLSPNIVHVLRDRPTEVFGHKLAFREHSSDVMRIQALIEYGGVFMDFDEVLLRPIDALRRFNYVQGREQEDLMGSQVVLAIKNATFLNFWYQSYREDYKTEWTYNALIVPCVLAENHPNLIHVEGFNFTRPNWRNLRQIHASNYDWRTNYGMHIFERYYEQPIDVDIMRKLNTTVGSVSRHILLGNKELCKF